MKFLCDRCKTRYSIGDDRVRGKILKIRCKNCANVITVREGMPDADAVEAGASVPRRKSTTTQAPTPEAAQLVGAAPASNGGGRSNALGAAFASAMAKPPPALEEEWYVSIDGDQSGPFSLAEAQRWVAGRAFDAELHCWSEGFDDWLPVDKVSHFRGLRKKPPPPPAPPPMPRIGSGRASLTSPIEDEPKPLFAATMASLEKSAPAPAPLQPGVAARGLGLPALPAPISTPSRPSATSPTGQPAYTNGSVARAPATPIKPAVPASAKGGGGSRTSTAPGVGPKPLGFDASESALADSATVLGGPAFEDEAPVASAHKRITPQPQRIERRGANDAFIDAMAASREAEAAAAAAAPPTAFGEQPEDEPGDLDIGEVSRVVKLADLSRPPPRAAVAKRSGAIPTAATNPAMLGRATSSVPKLATSKLSGTNPVPLMDGVDGAPGNGLGNPLADLPHDVAAPTSHRRGMIALLVGAAVLVGTAVVVVALVMSGNEDATGLGGEYELNNERPDQVMRRPGDPPGPNPIEPQNPFVPKKPWRPPVPVIPKDPPPIPGGNSLKAEEIETMAGKFSGTTSSCYMRSQKGADGILIGDVKKITVTLSIAADGTVTDVTLSDNHAANKLGRCLVGAIRGWKFRTSPGGTFRFILHFG